MTELAREMKELPKEELHRIVESFDNTMNLAMALEKIIQHLEATAKDIGRIRERKKAGVKKI